jgi:hypothetical protein
MFSRSTDMFCQLLGVAMKITKRPKRVRVKYRPVQNTISEYTCPSCKVCYVGGGPAKNVTRFVCDCGQELIVS